ALFLPEQRLVEVAGHLPMAGVLAVQPGQLPLVIRCPPLGDDGPSDESRSLERGLCLDGVVDARLCLILLGHDRSSSMTIHLAVMCGSGRVHFVPREDPVVNTAQRPTVPFGCPAARS